ncbi:MAG TPA: acetate kinase [Tissierellia bacterium]|nr:acetate kinase [Tissierellia bacterium]
MKIFVINCGSSSLKFQLLDMQTEELITSGLVERIGIEGSCYLINDGQEKHRVFTDLPDHAVALQHVLDALVDPKFGFISSLDEISAVGHRVVHGAEAYASSVLIDDDVMNELEKCTELAPLHNPANIIGIEAIQKLMPGTPNVGVFDTAFHQTMEPAAYIYALPYEMYTKHGVRRYGFHGTSHKYVSERVSAILGRDDLKVVTCHLGNGASVTAIDSGKSVETSMGFTPLEGLVMGTRSGQIDPAIISFLMDKENMTIDELNNMLNKKSGILGVSGVSSDFRDVEAAADEGHERSQLALDVFHRRVKRYIASYAAVMGGLDAIVFTGGLGENSGRSRKLICEGMEFMGVEIDDERNDTRGKEVEISPEGAKVKIYVIPTNEELAIARDTLALTKDLV